MEKTNARIESVITKIQEFKTSISQLKSERDELKSRITQLEKEKAELMSTQPTMNVSKSKEIKEEIDKQVQELDACLDMLKTI